MRRLLHCLLPTVCLLAFAPAASAQDPTGATAEPPAMVTIKRAPSAIVVSWTKAPERVSGYEMYLRTSRGTQRYRLVETDTQRKRVIRLERGEAKRARVTAKVCAIGRFATSCAYSGPWTAATLERGDLRVTGSERL